MINFILGYAVAPAACLFISTLLFLLAVRLTSDDDLKVWLRCIAFVLTILGAMLILVAGMSYENSKYHQEQVCKGVKMYTEADLKEMFRHGYLTAAEQVKDTEEAIHLISEMEKTNYAESLSLAHAMVKINHY
jgi:ABC-type nickel/cobalt efflux system permease component RcnA